MKERGRHFTQLAGSLLVLFAAACGAQPPAAQVAEGTGVEHVVIIGIDGLSVDGINNAPTPVLDRMMAAGAYTLSARGVLPTSSSPNWKSMVAASTPALHGVTSNDWQRDDFQLPPAATGLEDIFPTLFGELRRQRPDAGIGAVYAWDGFGRLIERSALDYDVGGRGDQESAQLAARYLKDAHPELLFLHLDHLDHVGHSEGHKTRPYYAAVTQADALVGLLLEAAESAGIMEETVFIVSSDHGGIGYGHGGSSLDELEVPFLLYGAGVKQNRRIKEYVNTVDLGATAAHLLAVTPHPSWTGKAILSAFSGYPDIAPDPTQASAQFTLPSPTLLPAAHLYEPAGGFYLDRDATLEILNNAAGAEIRYTLDGSEPDASSTLYEGPVPLESSRMVKARAFLGDSRSQSATAYYRVADSNSNNGIRYAYYEGEDWHFLPTFAALEPVATGKTYQFRIGELNRREQQFGLVFDAWIDIEVAGEHKFYTYSDDGSKLFINGQEVVNNDGAHGTIERAGTIELEPGRHHIRVDYFNEAGGYWLEVMHKAPGRPRGLIMPESLYPLAP